MSYTQQHTYGAVHLQSITPLDERIVRMIFSAKVPGYKHTISDTLLSFYTNLALSGTKHTSKEEIHLFLQQNGIQLEVRHTNGFVHFEMTVRAATVKKAAHFLKEIIFDATVPAIEFKNVHARMREQNRDSHDNAKRISYIQFANAVYPKDSLLRQETLDEEKHAIQKTVRKNILAVQKALTQGEWYVSIVGNTKSVKDAMPLIETLEKHAIEQPTEPVRTTIQKPQEIYTTVPGKTNVELQIGNAVPISADSEEYIPFALGLAILGYPYGITAGRLMDIVREKEGLTYSIIAKTALSSLHSTGHWHIITFFTARDLEKGIASTMRELRKILQKGITAQELLKFKEILENKFLIAHESNERRLHLYHSAFLFGKDEADMLQEIERIKSLKKKEVDAALRAYLDPQMLIISGAGPVTKTGKGIF